LVKTKARFWVLPIKNNSERSSEGIVFAAAGKSGSTQLIPSKNLSISFQ
jgi:hypothetical protein